MFENGCAIQKTQVQKVLASCSLVPTRVSFTLSYSTLLTRVLECILGNIARGGARLPRTLRGRSPPRIQDQEMEVGAHTSDLYALCDPRG